MGMLIGNEGGCPMKALITGMKGTVAPAIAGFLSSEGYDIVSWDRTMIPVENYPLMRYFIGSVRPDIVIHCAMGSPEWAEFLARVSAERDIRFLFTSTASVYTGAGTGPYTPDSIPDSTEDYGRYKIDCEKRIRAVHSEAVIVRLGWQIGSKAGSNNMIDFIEKKMVESGSVHASGVWFPSCSFLEDTAEAVYRIIRKKKAGTYLLNGNRKYSFYQIVSALNKKHGGKWNVVFDNSFSKDDRMFDDRVKISGIEKRLDIR